MEFIYRARNKQGEIESDVLNVADRQAAATELRARGLMPISLSQKSKADFKFKNIFSWIFGVSLVDKITFLRNLSVMQKAGLALPRALQILATQMPESKMREVVTSLQREVQSGEQLSSAMAKFPNIFGQLYISLIQVGEAGGTLEKNLDYLVGYLRRDYMLVKKAKGALTYPIIVMIALVLVIILMFTFILPKLVSTFTELNVDLPFTTKLLIAMVGAFTSYSYLIIGGLIGLVLGLRFFAKTPTGILLFHDLNLRIPVISKAVKKLNLARFTLTLSSLLNSSMPIVEAVRVAGRSLTNHYYQEAVVAAAEKVRGGVPLSDALGENPKLFPGMAVQMIKVGEEAGNVSTILQELNDFYEEEVDEFIKNLSTIIEPVMVMIIGAVVAFLALALISPIYNISQNI